MNSQINNILLKLGVGLQTAYVPEKIGQRAGQVFFSLFGVTCGRGRKTTLELPQAKQTFISRNPFRLFSTRIGHSRILI